jgi:predicted phosphoadenosine phosphosulfate sulfurtransferase
MIMSRELASRDDPSWQEVCALLVEHDLTCRRMKEYVSMLLC